LRSGHLDGNTTTTIATPPGRPVDPEVLLAARPAGIKWRVTTAA
jgi:hypothetical protein